MTHIITSLCLRENSCMDVCPVECINPGESAEWPTYYIDPATCIDCGACVPECPVEAIYDEAQLPEDQTKWLAVNAEKAPNLPVINQKGEPAPGAEERKAKLGF